MDGIVPVIELCPKFNLVNDDDIDVLVNNSSGIRPKILLDSTKRKNERGTERKSA